MTGSTIGSLSESTQWTRTLQAAENRELQPDSEILNNVRENFKNHFMSELAAILEGFKAEDRPRWQAAAKEALSSVVDLTFSDGHKNKPEKIKRMLQEANVRGEAVKSEMEIRQRLLTDKDVDFRPQLVESSDHRIQLIRKAPNIEGLVLRGGGAKGTGLPTTLLEMQEAGMLQNIKHVAGSSAGAMTAALLAAGVFPDKIDIILKDNPTSRLVETEKGFKTRYPMYQGVPRTGMKTGGNIMEMIDREITKSIVGYLKEKHPDRASLQNAPTGFTDEEIHRLETLRDQSLDTCFSANRSGRMITFNDLHLMNKLNPEKFKELTITGCDQKSKQTFYFNAKEQPNLEIALAARISAALPPIFQALSLDLGSVHGVRTLIDGGMSSNMPDEAIFGNIPKGKTLDPEQRARTAVVGFADDSKGNEAYRVMHNFKPVAETEFHMPSPGQVLSALAGFVSSSITGLLMRALVPQSSEQTLKKDEESLRNAGPNAFISFHGDLTVTSFSASDARVFDAKTQARLKILEQLEHRANQAYYVQVDSVADAAALLTDTEKKAILEGGYPEKGTHLDQALFDWILLEPTNYGLLNHTPGH